MMEEKIYNFTKKQLNAEKNKVLAKFASVASHDLKNVVGGISNISYYLSKTVKPENENQQKMLNLLATEVVNLNKRITEVLDMTRVKQLTKTSCNLQDLILQAMEEVKCDGIVFEQSLLPTKIYGDKERIKQVFYNIIKNAEDALEYSGTIKIETKLENDKVFIIVSDSGKGMDQETLEQCFDPMFSTKLAKAVGMGLTVALQIIQMHNGTIEISSQKGSGTTVNVSLPILKEE